MVTLVRANNVTILTVESAGDGTAENAAVVELPTQHTILIVDATAGGYQAIKLPEGHIGDLVEVYFRSGILSGASRLRLYDAEDNNLLQTDAPGAMYPAGMVGMRKILSTAYTTPSGYYSRLVGTWVGNPIGPLDNYPPST
jgi:hypothetical protein